MNSKLARMLMAVVGSATLVVSTSAQQDRADSDRAPAPARNQDYSNSTRSNYRDTIAPVAIQPALAAPSSDVRPAGAFTFPRSVYYTGPGWTGGSGDDPGLAHQADQLARQLAEAKSDSDRDKLRAKLGDVLEKQFDQRQKRHEGEIDALEDQIKKLRNLVQKRQENRREIIGRRLDQILKESQGLGW